MGEAYYDCSLGGVSYTVSDAEVAGSKPLIAIDPDDFEEVLLDLIRRGLQDIFRQADREGSSS